MTILTRNDGIEFVMQAYREIIENGNKTALAQKVHVLAEQHGRFVRLFKKEKHYYEAVFSNEAGYLLGESVKHYFYQAQNLIFCEALENEIDLLLVVVRDGEVYLDAIVNKISLRQELRLLISDRYQYQIFTHGAVPMLDDPILPPEKIISFENLSDPLLPRLPTLKNLQLVPVELALKTQCNSSTNQSLIYLIISLLALSGGLILYNINTGLQKKQAQSVLADPYSQFNTALSSAEPHAQLIELMKTIELLYTIPGWQLQSINFSNNHYSVQLKNNQGDLTQISQWSDFNNFTYTQNNNQPTLTSLSHVPSRLPPKTISNEAALVEAITEPLRALLGAQAISIENTYTSGLAKQTTVTLNITQATPKILDIIGQLLENQPVTIENANFNNKDLTINGRIQFSIWGN